MRFSTPAAAALAVVIPSVLAQTSTDCNPTEKTCPADTGLNSNSYTADFASGSSANASWSAAAYTTLDYTSDGAVFEIAKSGQAPTIETDFYIFGGRVDVTMKAATGTGIVSSIVLESDDLDEIDWEFLGGSPNQVQSNFFGKGNTTSYQRVEYHNVDDTQNTFHTYTVDWNKDRIEWIIDGATVRTLTYSNDLTVYGKNYPQTPMRVKLGNWAGGDSENEGTVEWAGGKTDFSQGPFKMIVQDVSITNYNPGCEYTYGDKTGSWDSIEIATSGDSCSSNGGSSSGSSSSSVSASGSSATSASGSSSSSAASSPTKAPSSSHSVENVENTQVAVSKTITGSAAPSGDSTSAEDVSTGVATQPTAGVNGTIGSSTNTVSGPAATSSGVEASEGGAALNSIMAGASLLSAALALFML